MNKIINYCTIVIICLLISSCSIDWDDKQANLVKEQNNKITLLNKNIEELSNKNEKDCLNHYDQIKKEIVENNKVYSTKYDLIEVFYSESINECIFTSYVRDDFFKYSWKGAYKYWVSITNWKAFIVCSNNKKWECDIFDNKVKELKNNSEK